MPKPKTFWIAHDNDMIMAFVRVYDRKPKTTKRQRGFNDGYVIAFCLPLFSNNTGLTLRPGETKCVQLVEVKP